MQSQFVLIKFKAQFTFFNFITMNFDFKLTSNHPFLSLDLKKKSN